MKSKIIRTSQKVVRRKRREKDVYLTKDLNAWRWRNSRLEHKKIKLIREENFCLHKSFKRKDFIACEKCLRNGISCRRVTYQLHSGLQRHMRVRHVQSKQ